MKSPPVSLYPMSSYALNQCKGRHFFMVRFEEAHDSVRNRYVPHRHDFFEIFWIREGSGEVQLDLETHRFGPGSFLFISPRRVHAWKIDTPVTGEIVGFTEEFLSVDSANSRLLARMPFLYQVSAPPILRLEGEDRTRMDTVYADLRRDIGSDEVGQDDLLRARLTIILIQARRNFTTLQGPAEEPATSLLAWRFRLKLEEHFPQLLKVSDYAALLHVSRSHLNEGLRHQVGQTASDLIHERIVLEAKRLLLHSNLTISEIAYRLQFQDPSYFVRFFRRHTQVTPGQYRAEVEQTASAG